MFQAVRRIQTSLQQHKYFSDVGRKDAALFMTHTRNKCIFFLKDIHIQNDENVFFWFIYLIFIYFYKIKKKIYETKG